VDDTGRGLVVEETQGFDDDEFRVADSGTGVVNDSTNAIDVVPELQKVGVSLSYVCVFVCVFT